MVEEMRPTLPQNFIPFFSPSYRKKMKKSVLDGREIIMRWATPDFKIPRADFPAIIQELKDSGCAASEGTIKFTLSLYNLTWGFLRGDEDAKVRMQHYKDIKKSWYTTPLECLMNDGITWEIIQDTFEKERVNSAIAKSLSKEYLETRQLSNILPDPFEEMIQAINLQIRGRISNLFEIIKAYQRKNCESCEKVVRLGECLDNLGACQNEARALLSQNKLLKEKLQQKEERIKSLEEGLQSLLAPKAE